MTDIESEVYHLLNAVEILRRDVDALRLDVDAVKAELADERARRRALAARLDERKPS